MRWQLQTVQWESILMKAYINPSVSVMLWPYVNASLWPKKTNRMLFNVCWHHSSTEIGYWECTYYPDSLVDPEESVFKPIRVYGLKDITPKCLLKDGETHHTNKAYVTSPDQIYNYDLSAASTGAKLLVLNKGFSTSLGQITGNSMNDSGIIAWAPMPVRDKEMEVFLGHMPVLTGHPALKEN
jgi:hypothetical protein